MTVGTRGVMDISSGLCVLVVTAILTVVCGKDVAYSNANQGRCLTLLAVAELSHLSPCCPG